MLMNVKRRRRVLAIDEDPVMADWLKQVIEAEGFEVRSARNGATGEELYKYWRPDVVLAGLALPDVDGINLLKELKDIDAQPETIIMGGEGTHHARAVEAGRAGAFFFVEKPVSPEGLLDLVRQAVARIEERAEH